MDKFRRTAWEWTKTLGLALLISMAVRTAIVEGYWIPSGSMEPTLAVGDRILASKLSYRFAEPSRGDIVIFAPPPNVPLSGPHVVKRVVAVEGDIVEVRQGRLYVNGRPQEERYLKELSQYDLPSVRVPSGMLFVLGDNRNNSFDSHAWGFLPRENVEAKAFARYWPVGRAGKVE